MNCSRCGALLPDSATFCTACGSPIRTELSTTFSYLPPGTPSWPTALPKEFPYKQETTSSAVEAIREKGEPKSRRSPRGILVIAAVLLLTPLLGVALTLGNLYASGQISTHGGPLPPAHLPTPQATPSTPTAQGNQLPTPTSFHQSTGASKVGVSLKYPVDWVEDAPQSSTTSSSLSIHPQQRQLGILFVIGRFSPETSATISSPSEINQANLQAFSGQQTVHNFQLLANSVAQRQIGGATWTEQDAGYQDSNGNSMRFTTISVQHKKTYYTIILLSPQVYYDEAMQKDIQPMFDSLQFLA